METPPARSELMVEDAFIDTIPDLDMVEGVGSIVSSNFYTLWEKT